MDKRAALFQLAIERQSTRWPGYNTIGDYQNGAYECDFVSPYTKSASNEDAEVMIFLQDWSSDSRLSGDLDKDARDIGHTPDLPTNRNLKRLLKEHFCLKLKDTYATNLFPFIKKGDLSSKIPYKDLVRAAEEFALPQIRIIQPRIVICSGKMTFNAMRKGCKIPVAKYLSIAIENPFQVGCSTIWCQAHTGALGRNNRNKGGVNRVDCDWSRMAASIKGPA